MEIKEMINLTYDQRNMVFNQINILYRDIPDSFKVSLYEQLFTLEKKEKEQTKELIINNLQSKETLELLKLINNFTAEYAKIIKENYEMYNSKNSTKKM